jgi:hypothetical protein
VPEHVWEQHELETLVLADNGLTELSPRVGELSRLLGLFLVECLMVGKIMHASIMRGGIILVQPCAS